MPTKEVLKKRHPLETWNVLSDALRNRELNEKDCWTLLEQETKDKARINFMLLLYGRANTLRTTRERAEILKKAKAS